MRAVSLASLNIKQVIRQQSFEFTQYSEKLRVQHTVLTQTKQIRWGNICDDMCRMD